MTKLQTILRLRGLNQTDLYDLIKKSDFKTIGKDRINRLVNGKQKNYTISTAKAIATVLNVKIDEIVD